LGSGFREGNRSKGKVLSRGKAAKTATKKSFTRTTKESIRREAEWKKKTAGGGKKKFADVRLRGTANIASVQTFGWKGDSTPRVVTEEEAFPKYLRGHHEKGNKRSLLETWRTV